jgi:hypothetical protein
MGIRKVTTLIASGLKAHFFIEGIELIPIKRAQKNLFRSGPVDLHLDGDVKGMITLIPTTQGYKATLNIEFTEREPQE